ncbi:MAG: ABC-2 transporter permease [Clostridiaceae bacterium]|nr:ABC-2 transporter permease [Clostridiaceae bacterium]
MKGLLLKDFYTLIKQVRFFLLILLLMAILPGTSMAPFVVLYAVMLPVSILGYDERAKWDRYAAMLPYTKKSIVLSKYIMGYAGLFLASLLTVTGHVVYANIKGSVIEAGYFYEMGVLVSIALFYLAVHLPFMYKFGVEKGRLVFLALTAVVVFGLMYLSDKISKGLTLDPNDLLVYIIPAAIIANLVSIPVSIRIYEKKEF